MTQEPAPPTAEINPRLRLVRIDVGPDAREYITGQQRVTTVPLTIRRKSKRKVLTPPPGKYPTIRDMAYALKLEQGWMAEVLRMTTLAPDIIESILEGRQPRHLNLQTLRGRHAHLPRDWQEQRVMFGYAD